MTTEIALSDIPGGRELIDWFGYVPRFHDANLLGINLVSDGPSSLRIHAFRINVLDKHVVVTVTLEAVIQVGLSDFNLPGIIFELSFSTVEDDIQLAWTGSYGVEGTIRAKQARIDLIPGKPV